MIPNLRSRCGEVVQGRALKYPSWAQDLSVVFNQETSRENIS
jgi:hypothetical protein